MEKQDFNEKDEIAYLEKEFTAERQKETLPALNVSNVVLYVNSNFKNFPFDIVEGGSSNLGMFLTPKPEKYCSEPIQRAKIMPEEISGRSIFLGEFDFVDKEGRQYRDVDLKGTGTFLRLETGEYVVGEVKKRGNNPTEAKGLMGNNSAFDSKDCSEFFLSNGIRTNRVVAILGLKEIIDKEGNKISIEKAKEIGIISAEMCPVILVRAFNTKERIDYITRISTNKEKNRAILALEDARSVVAKELNRDLYNFSLVDYLYWFSKTLGEQIAKVRKIGVYSGNLHPQNITLDCSIADLEGFKVTKKIFLNNKKENDYREQLEEHLNLKRGGLIPEIIYQSEFDGVLNTLNVFLQSIEELTHGIKDDDKQRCINFFEEAYKKECENNFLEY